MPLLLCNSCAVQIHDEMLCAVVPGNLGAVCDRFLESDQKILNESQWQALQLQWEASGNAVECTTSGSISDLKLELEELCSKTACDYQTRQTLVQAFERIQATAKRSKEQIP